MIREFEETDIEVILDIWLHASIVAHDFIDADYWYSKRDDMRNVYFPSATTYVYENSGRVSGFISMVENYIAAIFVLPESQGKGIGKQLIDFVKSQYGKLELSVYKENEASVAFYKKQGFRIAYEGFDKQTKHVELIMRFEDSFGSIII